jgi:hypothetical protein
MQNLPIVIVTKIYNHLNSTILYSINKELFNIHYKEVIKEKIIKNNYYGYMRHLLRKNCHMHLELILQHNYTLFKNIKKWRYKNATYPNYLIYLKSEAQNRNNTKCKELIEKYIQLEPSRKNKYKRIRRKNIIWTN